MYSLRSHVAFCRHWMVVRGEGVGVCAVCHGDRAWVCRHRIGRNKPNLLTVLRIRRTLEAHGRSIVYIFRRGGG